MNSTNTEPIHLVLNCAESYLQVVLGTRENLLWSQELFVPGRAMKHIAPAVKSGLDFLEIKPHMLAGISCVEGPGSFTGIRMTFAHAMGMAMAADIPMSKISYFDALAHGPAQLIQGPALIFIHSRVNQVYYAGYSLPSLTRISGPSNLNASQITEICSPWKNEILHVLGSGIRKHLQPFQADNIRILPQTWDTPLPQSLLELSFKSEFSHQIQPPVYLRPSDAEENLSRQN